MPRNSKAGRILNDAEMRLEAARMRERLAQAQLNTAKETLRVLQEAYDALERELAPKSRTKAATAQTAPVKPATTKAPKADANSNGSAEVCGKPVGDTGLVCGQPQNNPLHRDTVYRDYHPFEASAPAQPAEKKSRRKAAAANSTPNSEIGSVASMGTSGD